jgi:chromosome segregation protein
MTRAELNQINNQYTALKTRIESLNSFILSADSKLKELSDKITAIDNEDNDIQTQLVVLKDTQNELKEILEKQDSDFVELNTKTSELSVNFNQKNIAFHQQSNRVNTLSQDYKYKSNQLNDLLEQLDKNKNIVSESSTNINDTRSKLKAMEDELLAGYEDRELIKAKLESAEQNYYKSKSKINELDNTVREVNKNKNLCEQSLLQFKDKMNDMRIDLSSIKERLSIEFNVDINEVLNQEPNPELQIDELTEKVTDLKSKIDKFGEINPMALEAYDEMKIRYDFIIAQKTDLENSKQTLMDTINEIESTAKTKFMDSFNSVRENFIRVFKTLFNEDDTADLILLNPEDPLESKIDIIAKPKGKRPQIIDQLSGGEKTLTATALLFSLYLLKPAPFCIFDEVDAPLDDANISKFNNIIRDFSNESQFIIVTHNKSTMSHVDVMYGVVMAELGVSQVAPVDFRNWN